MSIIICHQLKVVGPSTQAIMQFFFSAKSLDPNWKPGAALDEGTLAFTEADVEIAFAAAPQARVLTLDTALDALEAGRLCVDGMAQTEKWSCTNAHIKAERILRVLMQQPGIDIDFLEKLVNEAGPAFAREFIAGDQVPF